MAAKTAISSLPPFKSFGERLRYLRRQARLTQRELAIEVGYSESMISRLENGDRPPDVATIHGLFVPVLGVEKQPEAVARLIELANAARGGNGEGGWQRPADSMRRALSLEHRLPARLVSLVGRTEDDGRKVWGSRPMRRCHWRWVGDGVDWARDTAPGTAHKMSALDCCVRRARGE